MNSENPNLVISKLTNYWISRPYLRLGQIFVNVWRVLPEYKKNPEPEVSDLFYLTDNKFLEGLALLEKLEEDERNSQKPIKD